MAAAGFSRAVERCRDPRSWRSGPAWPPPEAPTVPSMPALELPVCRFYIRGNCTFGSRCRFVHADQPTGFSRPSVPNNWRASEAPICQPGMFSSHSQPGTFSSHSQPQIQDDGSSSRMLEQSQNDWANAPEFIPSNNHSTGGQKSYAQIVNGEATTSHMPDEGVYDIPLCPLMEKNLECKYGNNCMYIHGELCDICGHCSLHPTDIQQRSKHHSDCVLQTERKMEVSKAIDRSKDKSCGICFEVIMEKSSREQRFGILPNCNHCFCLTCIRKWRQAKQFENKIIRACPECRVTSDFVCPSMYWVHSKEEKETLIKDYKEALSMKDCKYFNVGRGKCPFGNKCFYRHAYPDGTIADVGPPVRQRRRNSDSDFGVLQRLFNLLAAMEGNDLDDWNEDELAELDAFYSDLEAAEAAESDDDW